MAKRYGIPKRLTAEQWVSLERRLLAKVDRSGGPDACWPFRGCINVGYGRINVAPGYITQASRAVWMLTHRRLLRNPKRLVCHHCDNRACCNPRHLFYGSFLDNFADMRRKGRSNRGERNGNAKLTAKKVRQIRELAAGGKMQKDIAAEFGLSKVYVSRIVTGYSWKHLPPIEGAA